LDVARGGSDQQRSGNGGWWLLAKEKKNEKKKPLCGKTREGQGVGDPPNLLSHTKGTR